MPPMVHISWAQEGDVGVLHEVGKLVQVEAALAVGNRHRALLSDVAGNLGDIEERILEEVDAVRLNGLADFDGLNRRALAVNLKGEIDIPAGSLADRLEHFGVLAAHRGSGVRRVVAQRTDADVVPALVHELLDVLSNLLRGLAGGRLVGADLVAGCAAQQLIDRDA